MAGTSGVHLLPLHLVDLRHHHELRLLDQLRLRPALPHHRQAAIPRSRLGPTPYEDL